MLKYIFLILILFNKSYSLINPFLNEWHCVGIINNIDFSKPYSFNVGELPLILWKKNDDTLSSVLNICKHMGSTLNNAKITNKGCLKCQYHGFEYEENDFFGKTIIHEGKIFWAYKPTIKKPYSVPFFYNKQYEKSFLEVEMPCSLQDAAYNTMDILHPAYVHNNLLGFGNNIPPTNIKNFYYKSDKKMVGLSFDYSATSLATIGTNYTKNFHMYRYPSFTWSRVTTNKNNHLIIAVNLLPVGVKKTKWFVTICHNYFKNPIEKKILKLMAISILSQDYLQMTNQYLENNLKKEVLFDKNFDNEEIVLWLNNFFYKNYEYIDMEECIKLYKNFKNN